MRSRAAVFLNDQIVVFFVFCALCSRNAQHRHYSIRFECARFVRFYLETQEVHDQSIYCTHRFAPYQMRFSKDKMETELTLVHKVQCPA